MNKICNLEKDYLLKVDPINFINNLECNYIFYDWIEKDLYLRFFNDGSIVNKNTNMFNNISIIGIYNIVANLTSIFFHDLLCLKHKKEFNNTDKPFKLYNTFKIGVNCNTFSTDSDKLNISSFTYSFNHDYIDIIDSINTKNISVYEHNIVIHSTNKSDFLRDSLFLYEAFVGSIVDNLEYF